jgi:hypothetical protein
MPSSGMLRRVTLVRTDVSGLTRTTRRHSPEDHMLPSACVLPLVSDTTPHHTHTERHVKLLFFLYFDFSVIRQPMKRQKFLN